jgi:ubiquinone/menaquinone biosynthesis C-methylase UbiE
VYVIIGHYFNKHKSTNPFVRTLVRRYQQTLQHFARLLPVKSVLEVGSGEGYILTYIREVRADLYLVGSDIAFEIVQEARLREPTAAWCVAMGEFLPFADYSFDLVIACEVLEHVTEPRYVLQEMRRLSKGFCIITVPEEPLWRILNILRGQYLRNWGNTPGHIHHWSRKGIVQLVGEYFKIVHIMRVFPWIFVLAAVD